MQIWFIVRGPYLLPWCMLHLLLKVVASVVAVSKSACLYFSDHRSYPSDYRPHPIQGWKSLSGIPKRQDPHLIAFCRPPPLLCLCWFPGPPLYFLVVTLSTDMVVAHDIIFDEELAFAGWCDNDHPVSDSTFWWIRHVILWRTRERGCDVVVPLHVSVKMRTWIWQRGVIYSNRTLVTLICSIMNIVPWYSVPTYRGLTEWGCDLFSNCVLHTGWKGRA